MQRFRGRLCLSNSLHNNVCVCACVRVCVNWQRIVSWVLCAGHVEQIFRISLIDKRKRVACKCVCVIDFIVTRADRKERVKWEQQCTHTRLCLCMRVHVWLSTLFIFFVALFSCNKSPHYRTLDNNKRRAKEIYKVESRREREYRIKHTAIQYAK